MDINNFNVLPVFENVAQPGQFFPQPPIVALVTAYQFFLFFN